MQKKIVRAMAGVSLYEPPQQFFTEFSLLVLDNINIYMTAFFVYKCLQILDFSDWFTQLSSIYHIRFNQTTPILVPRIWNKHSEQCVIYRGPKIWNELPLDVREQTYNCFKMKLKQFLLA